MPKGIPHATHTDQKAKPLFGGFVLAGIVCLATLCLGLAPYTNPVVKLLPGAFIITTAGWLRDQNVLQSKTFLVSLVLAAIITWLNGVTMTVFMGVGLVSTALTVTWLVLIPTAFVMLDVAKYIFSTVSAIIVLFLLLITVMAGQSPGLILFEIILAGFVLGAFFIEYKGKGFIGRGGAALFGFLIAGVSVIGSYAQIAPLPIIGLLAPAVIVALPVIDLVFVIGSRVYEGIPIDKDDRRHFYFRLLDTGVNRRLAIIMHMLFSALFGSMGVLALAVAVSGSFLIVTQAIMMFGIFLVFNRISRRRINQHIEQLNRKDDQVSDLKKNVREQKKQLKKERGRKEEIKTNEDFQKKYYQEHTRLRAKQRFNLSLSAEQYKQLCYDLMNYNDPHEHVKSYYDEYLEENVEVWRIYLDNQWVTARFIRSIHKIITVFDDINEQNSSN